MRRILVFILILSGSIYAQNNDEFKIGIALRGGGALGFAHIMRLDYRELNIPVKPYGVMDLDLCIVRFWDLSNYNSLGEIRHRMIRAKKYPEFISLQDINSGRTCHSLFF